MGPSLFDHDGLRGADTIAGLALGAVVLVDVELVPQLHHGIEGTGLFAEPAEDAVLRPDAERPQSLAALGAAVLVTHVLLVFFAEIFDRREHGVRRAVSETAEGAGNDQSCPSSRAARCRPPDPDLS